MDIQLVAEQSQAEKNFHEDDKNAPASREFDELGGRADRTVDLLNDRTIAERHLLRKLDVRFMPTIFLIIVMNFIDVS